MNWRLAKLKWWFLNARIGPWGAPNPLNPRQWFTFKRPKP